MNDDYRISLSIPKEELDRWNRLIAKDKVDYAKENLPRFSCVFLRTVKFPDGVLADLKVCTSDTNQKLWSEMVVYDEHGHELWLSEASECLDGPWGFSIKNIYKSGSGVQEYVVDVVGEEVAECVYDKLGSIRDDFCGTVLEELEAGISNEYSTKIADAIADDVAMDVLESADPKKWNGCDVRLAIGRVLLRDLGVEV